MERVILDWHFDRRSEGRLAIVDRYDLRVIGLSDEVGRTTRDGFVVARDSTYI